MNSFQKNSLRVRLSWINFLLKISTCKTDIRALKAEKFELFRRLHSLNFNLIGGKVYLARFIDEPEKTYEVTYIGTSAAGHITVKVNKQMRVYSDKAVDFIQVIEE